MTGFWSRKWPAALLLPLSWIYRAIVALRNGLYDRRVLRSAHPGVRVISVGNITVGGTGKTPLVLALVRGLWESGIPAAMVSRGYGRRAKETVTVSDGVNVDRDPDRTGDEPLLIALRMPGIPVIAGDRVAGSRIAAGMGAEFLVLDDAFQHRRIARDLDIVVLDASCPAGNGMLIPAGPLREPFSALKRAGIVVITRIGPETGTRDLLDRIRKHFDGPVLLSRHRPAGWADLGRKNELGPLEFKGKRCLAFAGIGSPAAFGRTLEECGVEVVRVRSFPDHYRYTEGDLGRIAREAERMGADTVVTTEKDAVRIREWKYRPPLYFLKIDIEFMDRGWMKTVLAACGRSPEGE